MILTFRICAGCVAACALATAAVPEEHANDPDAVWDLFVAECMEATVAPIKLSHLKDILTKEVNPEGHAALSADGKIHMGSEELRELESEEVVFAMLHFGGERLPDATSNYCSINLSYDEDGIRLDLNEVAARRAKEVIGTGMIHLGGQMVGQGGTWPDDGDEMPTIDIYTTPESPAPLVVRAMAMPRFSSLSMFRHIPNSGASR